MFGLLDKYLNIKVKLCVLKCKLYDEMMLMEVLMRSLWVN